MAKTLRKNGDYRQEGTQTGWLEGARLSGTVLALVPGLERRESAQDDSLGWYRRA